MIGGTGDHGLVIGLFTNLNHASVCLSNLAEEEFESKAISLVMKTPRDASALANVCGPLNGLTPDALVYRLTRLGVTEAEASAYRDGIAQGGVFIAVGAGPASAAAKETLEDHEARNVRIV